MTTSSVKECRSQAAFKFEQGNLYKNDYMIVLCTFVNGSNMECSGIIIHLYDDKGWKIGDKVVFFSTSGFSPFHGEVTLKS